jgi:hypothetical protein
LIEVSGIACAGEHDHNEEKIAPAEVRLSNAQLDAANIARNELKKIKPEWSAYQIEILEDPSFYVVTFWRAKDVSVIIYPSPGEGQPPPPDWVRRRHAINVKVDKNSLEVIKISGSE